jgi:hypothetical protein
VCLPLPTNTSQIVKILGNVQRVEPSDFSRGCPCGLEWYSSFGEGTQSRGRCDLENLAQGTPRLVVCFQLGVPRMFWMRVGSYRLCLLSFVLWFGSTCWSCQSPASSASWAASGRRVSVAAGLPVRTRARLAFGFFVLFVRVQRPSDGGGHGGCGREQSGPLTAVQRWPVRFQGEAGTLLAVIVGSDSMVCLLCFR